LNTLQQYKRKFDNQKIQKSARGDASTSLSTKGQPARPSFSEGWVETYERKNKFPYKCARILHSELVELSGRAPVRPREQILCSIINKFFL